VPPGACPAPFATSAPMLVNGPPFGPGNDAPETHLAQLAQSGYSLPGQNGARRRIWEHQAALRESPTRLTPIVAIWTLNAPSLPSHPCRFLEARPRGGTAPRMVMCPALVERRAPLSG